MTEMVTSGSRSGAKKRNDGLLGEGGNERRRPLARAPPGLYVTALRLDSTGDRLVRKFLSEKGIPTVQSVC